MSPGELMTILINFHQSHYKDFKSYYLCHVHQHLRKEFPNLLSYTRFLGVMSSVLVPLCAYFTHCKGKPTGIAFVDASSIKVCQNIRIPRHKVFDGVAQRAEKTFRESNISVADSIIIGDDPSDDEIDEILYRLRQRGRSN